MLLQFSNWKKIGREEEEEREDTSKKTWKKKKELAGEKNEDHFLPQSES